MAETTPAFDDGEAYERFMGRWSRAAGTTFLDWLKPPRQARWLDLGCGTGAFTELVAATCAPAALTAVDPSPAQIDHARRQPIGRRADFRVADAQQLPFADDAFDVVVSALVINFIPDRARAVAEMRRVARPGGQIAGYVWDFATNRSTAGPLRDAMRQVGLDAPVSGTAQSTLAALQSLFWDAGLSEIETRPIDITVTYPNVDELWRAQTPSFSPATKAIATLSQEQRARMIEWLRAHLPVNRDGHITYPARANAIKARVP
jgi:ubiquinone/menaquinone biosynthesis C-methylase UbiE